MKVQVKDKQGIDEAGNKHPAPGIADGTHECKLGWGERKSIERELAWVLAEQDKEVKTAEEVFNDYINIRTVGNDVAQNIIDAMVTYAAQFRDTTISSTRIAELQARVAQLEGVIKSHEYELINAAKYGYEYHMTTQFPDLSFNENCRNNFLQFLQGRKLATNALKNQQP